MDPQLDAGRRLIRLAACAVAGLMVAAAGVGAATAAPALLPQASGRSGACTTADENAVTVVIDYQNLGGGIKQYCASGLPKGAVGMDALKAVGLSTTGTNHDGAGFVCRIDGRPSAKQSIRIPGNDDYRENCVNTPPATAYWSYWWAKPGGSWVYSDRGVQSHRVVFGGYEGWSFSNDPNGGYGGTNPAPGVKPVAWATPPAANSPKPTATQPTTPKPAGTKSSTPKPAVTKSSTPKPAGTKSSTPRPTMRRSSTPEPTDSGTPAPSRSPASGTARPTESEAAFPSEAPSTGAPAVSAASPNPSTSATSVPSVPDASEEAPAPSSGAAEGPGPGLIAATVLAVGAAMAGGVAAVRRRRIR